MKIHLIDQRDHSGRSITRPLDVQHQEESRSRFLQSRLSSTVIQSLLRTSPFLLYEVPSPEEDRETIAPRLKLIDVEEESAPGRSKRELGSNRSTRSCAYRWPESRSHRPQHTMTRIKEKLASKPFQIYDARARAAK